MIERFYIFILLKVALSMQRNYRPSCSLIMLYISIMIIGLAVVINDDG